MRGRAGFPSFFLQSRAAAHLTPVAVVRWLGDKKGTALQSNLFENEINLKVLFTYFIIDLLDFF